MICFVASYYPIWQVLAISPPKDVLIPILLMLLLEQLKLVILSGLEPTGSSLSCTNCDSVADIKLSRHQFTIPILDIS
jgi:hypothetical protein